MVELSFAMRCDAAQDRDEPAGLVMVEGGVDFEVGHLANCAPGHVIHPLK
jgi:hypothetical protein